MPKQEDLEIFGEINMKKLSIPDKYEYKTYGTAKLSLEAGYYTIADLEYQIAILKGMNAMNRKSMELLELTNGPSEAKP